MQAINKFVDAQTKAKLKKQRSTRFAPGTKECKNDGVYRLYDVSRILRAHYIKGRLYYEVQLANCDDIMWILPENVPKQILRRFRSQHATDEKKHSIYAHRFRQRD